MKSTATANELQLTYIHTLLAKRMRIVPSESGIDVSIAHVCSDIRHHLHVSLAGLHQHGIDVTIEFLIHLCTLFVYSMAHERLSSHTHAHIHVSHTAPSADAA